MSADFGTFKNKLNAFVLNEIDSGELSDVQIAKMLLDVSMNYLKSPVRPKENARQESLVS